MRIIAKSALVRFWERNPNSKRSLERWYAVACEADWSSMGDLQATLPNVTVLNDERVKFEIGGGNYRLIVAIKFRARIVFVKFVGTHAEYDKIDALTVSKY